MLRDRYFFPLCAVAAIAMITLALAGPWAAGSPTPEASGQSRERAQ
jgi:hypothetical protein